jgi:rhodanese-related sulfurtransferase
MQETLTTWRGRTRFISFETIENRIPEIHTSQGLRLRGTSWIPKNQSLAVLRDRGNLGRMKFLILSTALLVSVASVLHADEPSAPVKIEQAEKQLAAGAQLLDVRTKEEWDEGHLKGATLVTVTEDDFLKNAKAVLDPKKQVVVYCRSGKRSAMATKQLRAAGFVVYDLEGGINAWINAGKPVVKTDTKP